MSPNSASVTSWPGAERAAVQVARLVRSTDELSTFRRVATGDSFSTFYPVLRLGCRPWGRDMATEIENRLRKMEEAQHPRPASAFDVGGGPISAACWYAKGLIDW